MANEKVNLNGIVDRIAKECQLFQDQMGDPFIAPNKDGTEVYKIDIRSKRFRAWLSSYLRKKFNSTVNSKRLDDIIQLFEGIAIDRDQSPEYPLELRTKINDDFSELFYDLGRESVRVDKDGWRIVAYPDIMFRRFPHQQAQSLPEQGGNILELANFVNLTDKDDILLFLVFTVAAFLPGYPRPLCLLFGSQGSGKSTPGRLLKKLIDPTKDDVMAIPTSYDNFVRIANRHAFLVFDNISSIKPNISDSLARVSTGDSFSKRELYTDDDDVIYKLQRPVMLNGINQVINQSDLLDRAILLEMQRIEPSARLTEAEFWQEFETQKPLILGAIFDTIAKTLKKLPKIKLDELPRMADFCKIGAAIADSIDGYTSQDFIDAYSRNIGNQHYEALNSNSAGLAVYLFMTMDPDGAGSWVGTATELLRQIEETGVIIPDMTPSNLTRELHMLTKGSLWPKDPAHFVRRLNYATTDLEALGITVEIGRSNNRRYIKLVNHNKPDRAQEEYGPGND